MVGTFACPECGAEVAPAGLSPGRQVRCACCETLVEVPFLPRIPSTRGRRRWRVEGWSRLGLTLALVGVVLLGLAGAIQSWSRTARERELAALIAEADRAERCGRPDRALSDLEAVLELARDGWPSRLGSIEDFRRRRDAVSRREAEARLAAAETDDPARAVGECRTLWDRAQKDPALEALRDRIGGMLARLAEAVLDQARRERADVRPDAALRLCQGALTALEGVSSGPADRARDYARGMTEALVEGFGAVVEPAQGERLQLGSAKDLNGALLPLMADALRQRHYLLRPEGSPLASLWDGRAAYRLAVEVSDRQDVRYLDTAQKATRIEARFVLSRRGWPVWELGVQARTPVGPSTSASFAGSRLLLATKRDPQIERRLYDEARDALIRLVPSKLRDLPPPAAEEPAGPATAAGP
jgi:hypothetical protein